MTESAELPADGVAEPADDVAPMPRRALILNVNDAEGARYLVSHILTRAGFDVIEAGSGEDALARIAADAPDLVVLDVRLPDIDGIEVCRRVRETPRERPIKILHTSATYIDHVSKVQSLDNGSDGYLFQPFEPEELVATVRSLLRLNDAEQELIGKTQELRDADRRKDEFLAMLAHELRNPLAAISASLPVIERREPLDDIERHARDVLERQVGHLARLVNDLLDIARVTQGKIELHSENVDLVALLERVADQALDTRLLPRKQTLRKSLPRTEIIVIGDVTRLEQVFANLLDNASKYTQRGGTIELGLTVDSLPEPRVRVRVRDDGIGMTAATLPTIFDLFAQAEVPLARSRGGLGIGLTVVRTLIELHKGEVHARSEGLDRGSEFEVVLPLAPSDELVAQPDSKQLSSATRTLRVLLIEDSADVRETMKDLLELWGHEVLSTAEGTTGVELARAEHPDVALVDIGLPDIDGYEVANRLHQREGAPLLIALTGYGSPEQQARALASGFDYHFTKPINAQVLSKLLSNVARRRSVRPAAQQSRPASNG